jgi:Na+/H+ antiporter NhaC
VPKILGNGESQRALFWGALSALALATLLAVGQRILSLGDALRSAANSAKSLVFAVVILVLAWSIGQICKDLGTAQFLTAAFLGSFSPWLLPVVLFLLSSLVSFSTGTSYGTMAILLPNVVVLAHTMGSGIPELGGTALMILTIGAVLEGSIFGDHCSPISDTTVLSSVATGSDHLHHVRTQAPYAVMVMGVAVLCGYIPAAVFGPAAWPLCWLGGILALLVLLFTVGRRP